MRISDWSSDVCSSDLPFGGFHPRRLRIDRLLQNLIDRALNKHRSIIMQNDGPPEINFIDLTADIVSAHVSNNSVAIRSEEHTSELQFTNAHLVCRLLLENKKNKILSTHHI